MDVQNNEHVQDVTSTKTALSMLSMPLRPSFELSAVVGSAPLTRADAVSKVWHYIKERKLQNPQRKREIMADEKLQALFGKNRVSMFEMNNLLYRHPNLKLGKAGLFSRSSECMSWRPSLLRAGTASWLRLLP
jgi:upstream activation factor subunit UAF30